MSTLTAIITVLKAWTAINAAVSGRIYGLMDPGAYDKLPCIVLERIGGRSALINEKPIHEVIVLFHCLAATSIAADAVAVVLAAQLNGSPSFASGGYRLSEIIEREGQAPRDVIRQITEAHFVADVQTTYEMTVSAA